MDGRNEAVSMEHISIKNICKNYGQGESSVKVLDIDESEVQDAKKRRRRTTQDG